MKSHIYIAGTGNLATALGVELQEKSPTDYQFAGWLSRNPEKSLLKPVFDHSSVQFQQGDVVFLCVQDKYIFNLAAKFQQRGVYVVHCSGAQPLEQKGIRCDAAFWPVQTFRAGIQSSWAGVPILIQSENATLTQFLFETGELLSARVVSSTAEQRLKMHLAAVFANNFVNALIRSAEITAESIGYSAEFIHPILKQTVINAIENGAINTQTGPAFRGDEVTIQKHFQLLENEPEMKRMYEEMTTYISFLFK